MSRRPSAIGAAVCVTAAMLVGAIARAQDGATSDTQAMTTSAAKPAVRSDGLMPLSPEVSEHPYHLDPGVRPYQYRLSVSPAYGYLGSSELFSFRLAYNPSNWLGYEASLGHNPGQSVHAVLHTFSAIVRRPLPGRLQPYLTAGYGMVIVFPGQSLNAAPGHQERLGDGWRLRMVHSRRSRPPRRFAGGHGVRIAESPDRSASLYDYVQGTIGLAFYRSIRP